MRDVDVLVIGAGAGGAAVTWRLARQGLRVVCLEQGDWVSSSAYPTTAPDWEVRRQREWNPNPNIRRLPTDYPIDDADSPIKPLMFNGVGGSTMMWSAHAPRFHPSDFRTATVDGFAADWPLDYTELEPYYDLNDEVMGIAGLAGDPANPERSPRQTPPAPLGRGGARMAAAFERLGWHWWPSDIAINSRPYGTGRGACNNCGPCELGCVHEAKATTAVTYWPAALEAGAELRTGSRVREVTADPRGHVTGASYLDADGAEHHQAARAVVLAANGVGTPRLLLLSHGGRSPEGLGNRSGLVGKGLMLHPIAFAIGVFDEALQGHKGITACSILSQEFYETDSARGFVRGYEMQVTRSHGPLITALGGFGVDIPWGNDHHRRFGEVFDHTVGVAIAADDAPDDRNTVTLHPSLTDSSGIPAPVLTYRIDENSRRLLDHGLDRASQALREAGAREVFCRPLMAAAGFHLMGTARMGEDPATSVLDRWGRSHDVENLFITDGSAFVTAAAVNPTPTIQALALRTADHVAASI